MSITSQTSKSYSGFTPTSIPGCQLWLDASDASTLALSGTTVNGWNDKSGKGNNITTVGTITYNSSTISVQTSKSAYFTTPVDGRKSTVNNMSIFLIYQWLGYGLNGNEGLWGSSDAGWSRFQILSFPVYTDAEWGLSYGNTSPFVAKITALNTASTVLYCAQFAYNVTNGSYMFLNGTQQANFTDLPAAATETTALLQFGNYSNANYLGQIAFKEILFYNTSITTYQRQQIEGYLARKWGLTSSLPTTHQFKITPIYTQPFQPIDIDGCTLWLDAADKTSLALSGSTVVGWRDKSTNAYTGASSGSPTLTTDNGLPAISFNGSTQYFDFGNVNNFGTSQMHIFSVARFSNTSDGTIIAKSLYGPGAARYSLLRYGSNLESFNNDTTAAIADSNTSTRIITFSWNRTTLYLYVNGNQSASTSNVDSNNLSNTNNLLVGAYNNGSGGVPPQGIYFTGYIMEIVMYQTAITTSQRQQIESYLAKKWGLQSSLPSTHPFKLYPTLTTVFNPLQIPGCSLWLDAADSSTITLTSSAVSQWNNKTGGTSLSQGTAGNRPTVVTNAGRQMLLFNNSWLYSLSYPFNWLNSSFFIVFQQVQIDSGISPRIFSGIPNGYTDDYASKNGINIVGGSGSTNIFQVGNYNYTTSQYAFNTITGTPPSPLGIYSWILNNNSGSAYGNGTQFGTTTTFTMDGTNGTGLAVGHGWTGGGFNTTGNAAPIKAWIGEVLLYNSALTTYQRQQVEGYLAGKWGLRSLPSTHPYRIYSTPFSPKQISGIQLWLDAADTSTITLNSTTLTAWNDKSGTNKTITVNSGPTYSSNGFNSSYPCFTFTTSNYLTTSLSSAIGTGDCMLVAVIKNTVLNTSDPLSIGTPGGPNEMAIGWNNGEGRYKFYQYGTGDCNNNSAVNNTNVILIGTRVSTTMSCYVNGSPPIATTTNAYNNPNSSIYIGGGGFPFAGQICELLLYVGATTTTQRQQVEGYLANKWGLQASLPSNHPHRYFKP